MRQQDKYHPDTRELNRKSYKIMMNPKKIYNFKRIQQTKKIIKYPIKLHNRSLIDL